MHPHTQTRFRTRTRTRTRTHTRTRVTHNATNKRCQLNSLAEYLLTTASCFHRFYGSERVLGHSRQAQRLELCRAVRAVLGSGLHLLGVTTLERV